MKGSRGVRRGSFTLVTPANHYPSRLPPFGDAPVVKLVTPRFAPARIGGYLLALPAGGGTVEPVAPGFETFLYALEGDAGARVGGRELALPAGGYAYLPAEASFELSATTAARLLMVKRRYGPLPGTAAPGLLHGHRDDEPFADTPVPGFRRRELLPVSDPAFDFAMSLLSFDAGVGLDNIEVHDEEHGLSRREGMGRVVVEAFCRGRAVVGTRGGGIEDLVRDDETGLLVPSDDVGALVTALVRVLTDPELAQRLAASSRTGSERWYATPEEFALRMQALVEAP